MYLGGILTILFVTLWGSMLPPLSFLLGGSILLLPGGIDGTTQMFGDRESSNRLRAITGLFLGIGVVLFAHGILFLSSQYPFSL